MPSVEENIWKVTRLVKVLSTSGKKELNDDLFKQVKKICKTSDKYVTEVFNTAFKMLKKNHAEIRFSAFQICEELFKRSHCFRELFLDNFKEIIELILGTNHSRPLPEPKSVAKQLKKNAVVCIKQWYDTYKDGYSSLKLGYNYLKECHKIDFINLTERTAEEQRRDEQQRIILEDKKIKKIAKISNEIEENNQDIKSMIVQFENTFNILIPKLKDFYIPLSDEDTSSNTEGSNGIDFSDENLLKENLNEESNENHLYGSDYLRSHGICKGVNVQINLEDVHKVYETEDNDVIISTLKEQISSLTTVFLPKIRYWEQQIIPHSNDSQSLLRQIIDLKRQVEMSVNKFTSVTIIPLVRKPNKKPEDESSSDDDDFIEVPFNDPRVISAIASEAELLALGLNDEKAESCSNNKSLYKAGPSGKSSLDKVRSSGSSSLDKAGPSGYTSLDKAGPSGIILPNKLINSSPKKVCPDSYLDDNWKPPALVKNSMAGLSQVWNTNDALHDHEDVVKSTGILGIDTRPIDFEREFVPVKWECRAPLKSGRLCPRKDREKCPLHGLIVARDEVGMPINIDDAKREQRRIEMYERDNPDWQNPQLLAEIKAQTGIDLDLKKAKKRKCKYPNLTNLRAVHNNPRNRLSKKIFNKKAIRRVDEAMSKCDNG